MIALIAIAALMIVLGVVVGVTALIVAIVKAIVRRCRGSATREVGRAPSDPAACSTDEIQEFIRIVEREWPRTQ